MLLISLLVRIEELEIKKKFVSRSLEIWIISKMELDRRDKIESDKFVEKLF